MSDGVKEPTPAEDDLDRALRELTEGTAGEARFRELSARERAKAAKGQARQAGKRAGTRARKAPAPSAGWRGGYRYDLPARELRRQGRRASRRRALKATAWIVTIVVLAGAGVFAYQHFAKAPGGPNDIRVVTNGAVPAVSGGLSGVSGADNDPPADPFAGTPADHWANGAAGIVVPTATAIGQYSATEVAQAYQTTRRLLIAQDLDHTTLMGGAPAAFAGLLVPGQRTQFLADLDKIGRQKNGQEPSTRALVASFAPGTAALVGSVIKVHGTMTARATTDQGNPVLAVEVNYRIVYPVEPPRAHQDWMRIVVQATGPVEFGTWQDGGGSFEPWVLIALATDGARCDSVDGYIHPDYPSSSPDKVQPSGQAIDPYSMQNDSSSQGCQRTTGT
ncbi:MAG TPA: hypothetical protein VMG38_06815 [Trebonia sp.]|nr:hypothetical protein [Trebonia sp.]